MSAVLDAMRSPWGSGPFDLENEAAYRRWRDAKLARYPRGWQELVVDVHDPRALTAAEREALRGRIARANMAVYRSRSTAEDKDVMRAVGRQLGLRRLDANWLADDDGISSITPSGARDDRGGFIPYTTRPLQWHTDGYYHPVQRRIRAMVLHCVRPSRAGGANALFDHELAYIALRDANPDWVRALMAPDAMTVPARETEGGVARETQGGPVFSVDGDGALHMRYTARTRSIAWREDAATRGAVEFLQRLMSSDAPGIFRLRLEPGMGLVTNNVLHDREGFDDDPAQPRLLYRARYLERVAGTEAAWLDG